MNLTPEQIEKYSAKVQNIQFALLNSNQAHGEFRKLLIKKASAEVLTEFDRAFPDMTGWEKHFYEFHEPTIKDKILSAMFMFVIMIPWFYGLYKFFTS